MITQREAENIIYIKDKVDPNFWSFLLPLISELSRKLEIQQKRSLAVILGKDYRSYSHALNRTNLPRLDELRETACLK